jgi:hypothetical protein
LIVSAIDHNKTSLTDGYLCISTQSINSIDPMVKPISSSQEPKPDGIDPWVKYFINLTDSIDHSFPKHFFIDSIDPSASHCFSPDDHRSNVFCRQPKIDIDPIDDFFWLTVPTYANTVNLCYFADIPHSIKISYPNVAFQILWFTGVFFSSRYLQGQQQNYVTDIPTSV